MCFFKVEIPQKPFLHTSQAYGFSLMCVLSWITHLAFITKPFSQTPHLYGFSSECDHTCFFKLELSIKPLLHTSQVKGFSPVCFLSWITRSRFVVNPFSQKRHLLSLSCEWFSKCLLRFDWSANPRPHTSQVKGFSPVCVLSWMTWCDLVTKLFSQKVHLCRRSCECFARMWTRSVLGSLKVVPQSSHLYGFLPLWKLQEWKRSVDNFRNFLVQCSHL